MWFLNAALLACTTPGADSPLPEGGVVPILSGPEFFDTPFPSDARLVNGKPSLEGFQGADSVPLFQSYIELAPTLDGWGNNSPIYLRTETAPDPESFPDPEESREDDSPVLLLDVDPASPSYGEATPVVWEFRETGDVYTPTNLLAILPVAGFPLRRGTTYALVVRPPFLAVGEMAEGWETDSLYAPLLPVLDDREIPTTHVAAATVFTTQDPVGELARIAWSIQSGRIGRPVWEPDLNLLEDRDSYLLFEGTVTVPIWQAGERPYREEGGFRFDEWGRPEVQGWERVGFALTLPADDPPEGGWPLVVYSHGTGGDRFSFTGDSVDSEGRGMAMRGVAMFGIAQPLHGDRATPDTNADFDTFNYSNPEAGRTSFRQGAADQIWLIERFAEGAGFRHNGEEIPVNPERLSFLGHSQGAMVGSLGASFMSTRVEGVMLSAAGGGTAQAAIDKIDPIPTAPLLAAALGIAEADLTVGHPVMGVLQFLSEATDPMNYAPYWSANEPSWPAEPVSVLMTEGTEDTYTPPATIEALSVAARLPIVGPKRSEPFGFDLAGLEQIDLPTQGDSRGYDGKRLTTGLAQFRDQGHFAIYDDKDARDLYRDYLESLAEGDPELTE